MKVIGKRTYLGYTEDEVNVLEKERKEREIIEKLAELEHEQWMIWSKSISGNEDLSEKRLERWNKLWTPYSELIEEQKEQDRVWARKVLKILEEFR